MSGVYIERMEMPKENDYTIVIVYGDGVVTEFHEDYWIRGADGEKQLGIAVPVPSHGRLIEESKVLDIVFEWCPDDDGSVGKDGDLREMLDEIEVLPTIIEAEEEI